MNSEHQGAKPRNTHMYMRWSSSLKVVCILVVLGLVFLIGARWLPTVNCNRPFNAIEWKAVRQQDTVRRNMASDLLEKHNFYGWTRSDILELLGPPDNNWSGFKQWDMVYVLGIERSGPFSLDDEALVFRLDEKNEVIQYCITVN